jgi:antitoxin component of RelBE/YafQ-DinJ toxin-antitoxin module
MSNAKVDWLTFRRFRGTLFSMGEKGRQVGFRFDEDLVERIDAYAQKMAREMPGLTFTRADAVRVLLEKALADAGLPALKTSLDQPQRTRSQ